ncbi:hypothetical protein Zm00014a_012514 [Zea mays]|uniref:Uncharacterized protein n=1 Tax=Zea mays TaxID=4577 RepID=A0A3L6ENW9_MAIZE|nr:hypothetical protein Zm00014a_012514 [Zea mays]
MARTPASMDVAPAACSPCLSSPSSFPSSSHGRLRAHPAPALFLPRPSPFFHGRRRFPVPRPRPTVLLFPRGSGIAYSTSTRIWYSTSPGGQAFCIRSSTSPGGQAFCIQAARRSASRRPGVLYQLLLFQV